MVLEKGEGHRSQPARQEEGERETENVHFLCKLKVAPLPASSLLHSQIGWGGPGSGRSQSLSQAPPLGHYLALGLKLILSGFQGSSSRQGLLLSLPRLL